MHLTGRSDFLNAYIHEIPAGGQTTPEQHMFDKLMYVISGRGATSVELPNGKKHTFEWGESAAFGIPLNARHQLFNTSGSRPARLAAVTSMPLIIGTFHNTKFVFDNPYQLVSGTAIRATSPEKASSGPSERGATSGRRTLCRTCARWTCRPGMNGARLATASS